VVRLLDALLGRTKPVQANLDNLFRLSAVAITLEGDTGLRSNGQGSVCFKAVAGRAFLDVQDELEQVLQLDASQSGTHLVEKDDNYGYHWVALSDPGLEDLVVKVHLVNSTLEERGFGPQLLCSVFGFTMERRPDPVHLVYVYKRGTFYPFAPLPGEKRDNELELQLRGVLTESLPVEPELSSWFPVWGVPTAG
jgi:hypothetical protein